MNSPVHSHRLTDCDFTRHIVYFFKLCVRVLTCEYRHEDATQRTTGAGPCLPSSLFEARVSSFLAAALPALGLAYWTLQHLTLRAGITEALYGLAEGAFWGSKFRSS